MKRIIAGLCLALYSTVAYADPPQVVSQYVCGVNGAGTGNLYCSPGNANGAVGFPVQVTGGTGGTVTANQGTANTAANAWPTYVAPIGAAAAGITPVSSSAAESNHVLKNAAGSLYSVYVTTGATGGYLMTFNATSAPSDGAVTPVDCVQAPANMTVGITENSGPPDVFSTGITAVFSTTGCFTKTASATAFFRGRVQ